MLKKRIIPIQLLAKGRLVKSVRFDGWRDVGDPVKSSTVYNSQQADELIFLNVERGTRSVQALAEVIERVSKVCFMPLAMGGGIASAEDAAFLILHGADKVVINSAAYAQPDIISRTAERFGAQACVICIDVRFEKSPLGTGDGRYVLYSDCGRRAQTVTLEDHIRNVMAAGAGEIMIQSIDRDGTMAGFDVPLIDRVMKCSTIPLIAAGGSGNYDHLKDVFLTTDVSAIACGSLFNFSDSQPMRAKAFLSNYGLPFKVV
jgi:imidazole glycerol-phosphate synthase subunit HisF